jgi:hypothetical protein
MTAEAWALPPAAGSATSWTWRLLSPNVSPTMGARVARVRFALG